jgi:hypothetical protein
VRSFGGSEREPPLEIDGVPFGGVVAGFGAGPEPFGHDLAGEEVAVGGVEVGIDLPVLAQRHGVQFGQPPD